MYGALLEREGLFRRSAEALRSALDCLDPERDGELCNKVFKLNRIHFLIRRVFFEISPFLFRLEKA